MAVRGRKPKPRHLKVITGNPSRTYLPPEPEPEIAIPAPPVELCTDARAEWDRVVPELFALRILSRIDAAALAAYCQAYGRWVRAERAIREMAKRDTMTGGLMIKTTNGNAIQNPLVGTANTAMRDVVRYAAEFGMTPSARARLAVEPDGPKSKFEGLIARA